MSQPATAANNTTDLLIKHDGIGRRADGTLIYFDLFASVFTTPTGNTVQSENWSEPLTIVGRTWGAMDGVPAPDLPADEVRLSSDGRSFLSEWHRGPESDESVYVEVRRRHGRSFHGWVDAESRKIVQAG